MIGRRLKWPAMAGWLVLLAGLLGCTAFREAPLQPAAAGAPPHGTGEKRGDQGGDQGHAHSSGEAPAPVVVSPEQPARTLRPDALDAPAATSVQDARRSAEMAQGMEGGHGGHGGHGSGHGGHGDHGGATYRQVDAGRGPEAFEGPGEPQAPGAESHDHDHGSAAPAAEQGHAHEASALYVCPMHPEVTSAAPGTCSKCGMALVERGKE